MLGKICFLKEETVMGGGQEDSSWEFQRLRSHKLKPELFGVIIFIILDLLSDEGKLNSLRENRFSD